MRYLDPHQAIYFSCIIFFSSTLKLTLIFSQCFPEVGRHSVTEGDIVYKTENTNICTVPRIPKLNVPEPSPSQAGTQKQQEHGEVAPGRGQSLPPLQGAEGCGQAHAINP